MGINTKTTQFICRQKGREKELQPAELGVRLMPKINGELTLDTEVMLEASITWPLSPLCSEPHSRSLTYLVSFLPAGSSSVSSVSLLSYWTGMSVASAKGRRLRPSSHQVSFRATWAPTIPRLRCSSGSVSGRSHVATSSFAYCSPQRACTKGQAGRGGL